MENVEKILNSIKEARKHRNITLKEMADYLGMALPTYADIERGRIKLKLEDYILICKKLNLPSNYFLSQQKTITLDDDQIKLFEDIYMMIKGN